MYKADLEEFYQDLLDDQEIFWQQLRETAQAKVAEPINKQPKPVPWHYDLVWRLLIFGVTCGFRVGRLVIGWYSRQKHSDEPEIVDGQIIETVVMQPKEPGGPIVYVPANMVGNCPQDKRKVTDG